MLKVFFFGTSCFATSSCPYCNLNIPSILISCQNQVGFDKQILSYVFICLLPAEVSLQLKILPKNIYKNKCREMKLIQFSIALLVYFECFNTVQIAHACLRRIFQCGRVYLHNDIYICYNPYNYLLWIFPTDVFRRSFLSLSLLTVLSLPFENYYQGVTLTHGSADYTVFNNFM